MFKGFLSRLFGKSRPAAVAEAAPSEPEVIVVNRYAAAENTRWNRAQFRNAHGQSINNDLAAQLPTLMARCSYEYAMNPMFEGVVNTFKDDVVGCEGPTLQVSSDDQAFNEIVEDAWRTVFADPDPSHRIGGPESMKCWVGALLLAGSYVNVQTTTRRAGSPILFGWRSVHPRRLVTPPGMGGDQNVAFGYRFDDNGAPIEYYIDRGRTYHGISFAGVEYDTIPAAAVQHCYMHVEAEQLTGAPLMASGLETAADLRQLERYVLESMKNCAANTPGLQANNPEAMSDPDPTPTSGELCYEPGQVPVAPKGWAWVSMTPTQPSAQYLDYRRQRLSELGRPIHMPLLVVLLTAADANFSSAQYEGTVYSDGVACMQSFIQRRTLNPFVMALINELALRRGVRVPKKFELVWTWNVPAHANIEKFVKAIRSMIEDGLIAPSQAAAMLGQNWEKVVAARKRCLDDLRAAGLPEPPVNIGNQQPEPDADETTAPSPPKDRTSGSRFSIA